MPRSSSPLFRPLLPGLLLFGALLGQACSAPDIEELPPDGPSAPPAAEPPPPPEPEAPAPEGAGAPDPVSPGPPPAPAAPSVEATPTAELPAPPFTAWTTTVPLTLVGPGGVTVAVLAQEGVRVDVIQVLEARMRVVCTGCTGATENAEGWLPLGTLRAAGHPGGSQDPLVAILRFRAGWAGGKNVPEGTNSFALCMLVDRGFTWTGDKATWADGSAKIELQFDGKEWGLGSLVPPPVDDVHTCRTEGVGKRPAPASGGGEP